MSRSAAVCLAIVAGGSLTWWFLQPPGAGRDALIQLPAGEPPAKPKPAVTLPQTDTQLCVEALRTPTEVELRATKEGAPGVEVSTHPLFRSHGKLDPRAKAEARRTQETILSSLEPQLRKASEAGDLKQAALLTEGIAIAKQALIMLERDDYLLLDQELVDKLWPASPEGWKIVKAQLIQLESGPRVTLVFPIRRSEVVYAEGAVAAGNIEWFLAEDAALRFNGLPDDQRSATLAAMDKWYRDETLDASERLRLAVLDPILKDRHLIVEQLHIDIDRARLLIRLSKR
jgi:hypothetical protein